MPPLEAPVIIAGGGPCGLMLAIELGCRGVRALLVDQDPGTAFNPQANATQARTMEYYRRLGLASEIRGLGLPPDYPTDIAYFTRFATYELARFQLPSSRDATHNISDLPASWNGAELRHRVSQKFVEPVLRRHAAVVGASVRYGWRLTSFTDVGDHVTAQVERVADGARRTVRSAYLVGADGARSLVRDRLGFHYTGETGVTRDFMGGRMLAVYLRCPSFYEIVPHGRAWMHVTYNRDRRSFMAAVDGRSEFAFHTQLRDDEAESEIMDTGAREMFERAVGRPITAEILSRGAWTAGHAMVSERFRAGRVFVAGDAAHLFTPAGGLGYNTAIEDAVNLGWKLATVLKGQGGPALLDSYERERLPLARRNTAYARRFAESLSHVPAAPELEENSPAGEAARRRAGAHFHAHGRAEFNIPGITFGGRYDASPIIVSDGSVPPPDAAERYRPTACPGGRPPHLWLSEGQSLFDRFGLNWTLLRLGPNPPSVDDFRRAAEEGGLDLVIADVATLEARDLFERDLVLIRPDQVVAWRSNDGADARAILAQATGRLS